MRALHAVVLAGLLAVLAFAPPASGESPTGAASLIGTWRVDLRPTPDAEAYYQEFVVTAVADDGTFTGTFYGTPIENARINTAWGRLHFAFTTSDGSGPYNTTGMLVEDGLEGTTHSLGREFLAVWTAVRVE
jgi:hypothetical protein